MGDTGSGTHGAALSVRFAPTSAKGGGTAVLACAVLALGGCGVLDHGFLGAAGPVADHTRSLFVVVCAILLLVAAPVWLLTPIFAWHYRLSNTKSAYGLALLITAAAFALVHWRWESGTKALGIVYALALAQAIVHSSCSPASSSP